MVAPNIYADILQTLMNIIMLLYRLTDKSGQLKINLYIQLKTTSSKMGGNRYREEIIIVAYLDFCKISTMPLEIWAGVRVDSDSERTEHGTYFISD